MMLNTFSELRGHLDTLFCHHTGDLPDITLSMSLSLMLFPVCLLLFLVAPTSHFWKPPPHLPLSLFFHMDLLGILGLPRTSLPLNNEAQTPENLLSYRNVLPFEISARHHLLLGWRLEL